MHAPDAPTGSHRVAQHRKRLSDEGLRRLEVTVPTGDADLIRELANLLRSGSHKAAGVRRALANACKGDQITTGADLVALFRSSPLAQEENLEIERDRSTGQPIDLS